MTCKESDERATAKQEKAQKTRRGKDQKVTRPERQLNTAKSSTMKNVAVLKCDECGA